MFVHRYAINQGFNVNPSLYLIQCGYEDCAPGHSYGPVIRDHSLIHFVFSGKGTLQIFEQTITLSSGQGFLIPAGASAKYWADEQEPWEYGWFGYAGEYSGAVISHRGLSELNNLFSFSSGAQVKKCLTEMVNTYGENGNDFSAISKLFEIFSYINPNFKASHRYTNTVNEIISYIEEHFQENITINDLSDRFTLSRSQIFRYFKEILDMSPQQYLMQYRMNQAANLLRTTDMSVQSIKSACGFNDLCNFIRKFKSVYHRSPTEFRQYAKTHTGSFNLEHSPREK